MPPFQSEIPETTSLCDNEDILGCSSLHDSLNLVLSSDESFSLILSPPPGFRDDDSSIKHVSHGDPLLLSQTELVPPPEFGDEDCEPMDTSLLDISIQMDPDDPMLDSLQELVFPPEKMNNTLDELTFTTPNAQMQELDSPLTGLMHEMDSHLAGQMHELDSPLAGQMHELDSPLAGQMHELDSPLAEQMQELDSPLAGQMQELVPPPPEQMQELVPPPAEQIQELVFHPGTQMQELHSPAVQMLVPPHLSLSLDHFENDKRKLLVIFL